MTASLPCSFICWPKIWPLAAICQGRKTTSTSSAIFETSAEKSVTFWPTDCRSTLILFARRFACTPEASGREYAVWSSMMKTRFAFRFCRMKLAIVGDWTLSFGTTRRNVGILPFVSAVAVAEPEMNGIGSAFLKIGATASTSWLPAGPTIASMFWSAWKRAPTVDAWAGSSWVSPSTSLILPPASLRIAYFAKPSCSLPMNAASPVIGPMKPIETLVHATL